MQIKKQFDYTPIGRVDSEAGRRYVVGPGRTLPSVTTILSKTKDMTFLNEWRESVGEAKASQIMTESSQLGTNMHNNIENCILGKPMYGSFMAKTLANIIISEGLSNVSDIWGTEVGLFSKDLYAGTTDLVGIHNGTPAIMDYKNSLRDKRRDMIDDYFMQLAAYAMSHNEMFGTTISKGVVMVATRDAKYQEFIIEGDEFVHFETMWANKVCEYYDKHSFDK